MTDFFEKLSKAMADGMTVNLTIAKKGDKLNVLFTPIPKDKKREDITPFVIKGTGQEIDYAYDNTMLLGTAHISGALESNANEFLAKAGAGTQKDTGMKSVFDQAPADTQPTKVPEPDPEPTQEEEPSVTEEVSADIIPEKEPTADPVEKVNKEFENAKPVTVGEKISSANAAQIQAPKQAEAAQLNKPSEPKQAEPQANVEPPKPSSEW